MLLWCNCEFISVPVPCLMMPLSRPTGRKINYHVPYLHTRFPCPTRRNVGDQLEVKVKCWWCSRFLVSKIPPKNYKNCADENSINVPFTFLSPPVPEPVTLNTSHSLYWNQSTLSYFIHINWTVPLIYDAPRLVQSFLLSSATLRGEHVIPDFIVTMNIPAVSVLCLLSQETTLCI